MKHTKLATTLLALAAGALAIGSAAYADGWFKELDKPKAVTLGEVLRNPREYIDVQVKLQLYWNSAGSSYNPYFTQFTREVYANFSAWPKNARLYEKRDFQRSYPFFFVQRTSPVWKKLLQLDRATSVEAVAIVRSVFRGQPWIEVVSFHTLGSGLSMESVREVVAGDACWHAGKYDEASKHYARAARDADVAMVQADLHRRAADAAYAGGEFRDALWHYQAGLAVAPESAVLQQGVEACKESMQREKLVRSGKAAPEMQRQPAPQNVTVMSDMTNDVDAIIAGFEDPAAVAAEVDEYRAAIARRGEQVRKVDETVAVPTQAGEENKEAAVVEEQPAPEQPAEQPVVEEQPAAEGCAPAEETPAEQPVVEEQPAPEQPSSEQPAEQPVVEEQPAAEGCAPAEVTPAEQPAVEEQPAPEQPSSEPPAEQPVVEEQPAAEGCAPAEQPAVEEQPAPEQPSSEQPAEQPVVEEQPAAEGCAPAEETPAEQPAVEEQPAAEGCAVVEEAAGSASEEESVATEPVVSEDPRAVEVAGHTLRLPRLPFFGCEEVTQDRLRSIMEEVFSNPE